MNCKCLFIFDTRIDIVRPGHLPNNLTVEKIRHGNSIIRNPVLVSYSSKGILPYRSLGSGIKRALDAWPEKVGLRNETQQKISGCSTQSSTNKPWPMLEPSPNFLVPCENEQIACGLAEQILKF